MNEGSGDVSKFTMTTAKPYGDPTQPHPAVAHPVHDFVKEVGHRRKASHAGAGNKRKTGKEE